MKLKNNTHVIIADSEKYLLLRNQGDEDIIDLRVVDSEVRDNPPTRELGTDRPGRFPTPSAQLSSVADTDWHGLFKTEAAEQTAEKINQLASTETDIVIFADSKTLRILRPRLTSEIQKRVVQETPKDLTHHTIPEIEKIINRA